MNKLLKSTAIITMVLAAGWASAASITLSTDDGVIASGDWTDSFRIESGYTQNGNVYTYSYTISSNDFGDNGYGPLDGDLSHFILEVSLGFTLDEIVIPGTLWSSHDIDSESPDLDDYEGDNSNPGLPTTLHGIKINLDDDTGIFSFSFDSYRVPMLGSFYAKGGRGSNQESNYAYNTGLSDPEGQFIWVPNTATVVPEPATITLLGMGIGGALLMRRRKNAS